MDSYTVSRTQYGIIVEGSVPVNDMCTLLKAWAASGKYALVDQLIAEKLGAALAITSKNQQCNWRNELKLPPP